MNRKAVTMFRYRDTVFCKFSGIDENMRHSAIWYFYPELGKVINRSEHLDMPAEVRDSSSIYTIKSYSSPELTENCLYLPGNFKPGDKRIVAFTHATFESANEYINAMTVCIDLINSMPDDDYAKLF